jgi:hypothetical protein
MEKITRKLADAFLDLNQLCLNQLAVLAKTAQKSELPVPQEVSIPIMNLVAMDSLEDEVVK